MIRTPPGEFYTFCLYCDFLPAIYCPVCIEGEEEGASVNTAYWAYTEQRRPSGYYYVTPGQLSYRASREIMNDGSRKYWAICLLSSGLPLVS